MGTETLPALPVPAALEKAVIETGLSLDGVHSLRTAFAPHFIKFNELREAAKEIPASAPKAARSMRLELKSIRVAAEHTRELLKEDSLRRGKAIDGINNVLKYELIPWEEKMEAIEKAEEIAESKRKAALHAERLEMLRKYGESATYEGMDLGGLELQHWDHLLAGAIHTKQLRIKAEEDRVAAEKIAAAARIQKEKDAAETQAKLRAENERLAQVAAKEKAAREESERVARLAAVEREAKARKEREAMEAKAREERQKREAAEAELKAQQEAEAKRLAEEKAAARKAAAAPDKQKLESMAAAIRLMPVPALTTDAGQMLKRKIKEQVEKFAAWLEVEAGKL